MKNTAMGHFKQNKTELKENTNIVLGALPLGAQIGCQSAPKSPPGLPISITDGPLGPQEPLWFPGAPWGIPGLQKKFIVLKLGASARLD